MRTWHQTFATSWVYLYKPHIKYISMLLRCAWKTINVWPETGQQYSFIWSGSGLLRPLRWGTPQNLLTWPIHIHHVLFKQSTRAEMGDLIQRIWKFDSHKDLCWVNSGRISNESKICWTLKFCKKNIKQYKLRLWGHFHSTGWSFSYASWFSPFKWRNATVTVLNKFFFQENCAKSLKWTLRINHW